MAHAPKDGDDSSATRLPRPHATDHAEAEDAGAPRPHATDHAEAEGAGAPLPHATDHAETEDDQPMVQVVDLVKRYDGRAVLDGINLAAYRGQTLVIMGGSGSGKSTLLRCMIGSIAVDAGQVRIMGQDICAMDEDRINETRKQFGILFQSGALFNSMTIAQNVALPLQEHTELAEETIDITVKIKLELVGLREHAHKYPAQISGGMKKRAGLARALALDPPILFYDEPSAGLDPVTSAQIDELIIQLSSQLGVASVVVTHEMDSAFRIADHMAMLDQGRIIAFGPRQRFEQIRHSDQPANEQQALIRQFLRGESTGPLTDRRQDSDYVQDLFSTATAPVPDRPAVRATRRLLSKLSGAAGKTQRASGEPT